MKYKWNRNPDSAAVPSREEGEVRRWGGYSSRHQYEQRKRGKGSLWKPLVQTLVLLILLVFAVFGVIALFQGEIFVSEGSKSDDEANTIKVPTQQELGEVKREADEMMEEVELSLVTVELLLSDGSSRFGGGFFLSEDGYALCSTALFPDAAEIREIRAYTVDGITYPVSVEGKVEDLGFSLIRLEGCFGSAPVSVGNFSFAQRGETVYAVPPSTIKDFPGTAKTGIISSKTQKVKTDSEGNNTNVPVMAVDMVPNDSLWGAPVVDVMGNALGFVSHTVPSPFGNMTNVVSIHVVYTMVNNMLGD